MTTATVERFVELLINWDNDQTEAGVVLALSPLKVVTVYFHPRDNKISTVTVQSSESVADLLKKTGNVRGVRPTKENKPQLQPDR